MYVKISHVMSLHKNTAYMYEAMLDIGRVNPKDGPCVRTNAAGACNRAAVTSGTGAPVRGGPGP